MGDRILVVDDDPGMRETLEAVLKADGYHVLIATNGKETIDILQQNDFEITLLDLKMPDCMGTELLSKIKELTPNNLVIMMTAYGTIETAVDAMKLGAVDYISKPIDLDELIILIDRIAERQILIRENEILRKKLWKKEILSSSVVVRRAMSPP